MLKFTKKSIIMLASLSLIATHTPLKVAAQSATIPEKAATVNLQSSEILRPYDFDDFDYQSFLDEMVREIKEETGEEISAVLDQNSNVVISYYNEDNEKSEIVVDPVTSEAIIDGIDYGEIIETETFVDYSKVENFSIMSTSDWSPVYYHTTRNTIKKLTGDLSRGAIYTALIITAVVSVASGIGLTAPVLLSRAKTALTSFGFSVASTLTGDLLNGSWSYDTYRTKGLVSTGGSSYKQRAYRYQNGSFRANFKIGNYTSPTWITRGKTGAWWFATRPY
ncbi:hypothetical protein [Alkalibacterium putridalgicola]|nr:hypothetical protein [Alkalibacterium putridalgicola]